MANLPSALIYTPMGLGNHQHDTRQSVPDAGVKMTKETPNPAVRAGLMNLAEALGLRYPETLWRALSPDGAFMEAVRLMAEMIRLGGAVHGGALTVGEGQDILAILGDQANPWKAANGPYGEDSTDLDQVKTRWDEETRRAARIDWLGRYGLPTGAGESERLN